MNSVLPLFLCTLHETMLNYLTKELSKNLFRTEKISFTTNYGNNWTSQDLQDSHHNNCQHKKSPDTSLERSQMMTQRDQDWPRSWQTATTHHEKFNSRLRLKSDTWNLRNTLIHKIRHSEQSSPCKQSKYRNMHWKSLDNS